MPLGQSRRSGKFYPHVEPGKRAVQRLKDRTRELTDRRRTPVPMTVMMKEVNQAVRGWGHYFHHRNSTNVFQQVKMHVEQRVRTQLRRRHKRTRAQAYERFPGHKIYGQYGPVQTADLRDVANCASLGMKNIGKPCTGTVRTV